LGEALQGEHFGASVILEGDTALVAGPYQNWFGNVGSVYWYEWDHGSSTWELQEQLFASDAQQSVSDTFGLSMAMTSKHLYVGARTHVDPVTFHSTGSVYVFVRNSGGFEELYEIVCDEVEQGHIFGLDGMAARSDRVVIGNDQWGEAPGVPAPGAMWIFEFPDEDEDGLLDCWEDEGIDMDADLQVDLDLPALGTDSRRKNMFVEVDVASGQSFPPSVATMVEAAFEDSPVENPDGTFGIDLDVIIDETNLPVANMWVEGPDGWPVDYDDLKIDHFGQGNPKAWRLVSRYCIVANAVDTGALGVGELPGNDFYLAPDNASSPLSTQALAGAFMHELGHNLDLRHGGHDDINGKPHYISVMNYLLYKPRSWSAPFWRLDYSRDELMPLIEIALDETDGIPPSPESPGVVMPYGYDAPDGTRQIAWAIHNGNAIDWDRDGIDEVVAVQDINYFGPDSSTSAFDTPSFGEVLEGHDDWNNLRLPIDFRGDVADLQHGSIPVEPTAEFFDWMETLEPPAPCAADLDGDGAVGFDDLLTVLSAWGTPGGDVDGDGDTGFEDLLIVLSVWGPCS
jgi:hypothetical protein